MNIFNSFRGRLLDSVGKLQTKGELPLQLDLASISVEPPRNPDHGDISTNAALVLAGVAKRRPREVAELLATLLSDSDEFLTVEVAGPGFLNVRFSQRFWHDVLHDIIDSGEEFGRIPVGGSNKIILEFVSANPTGPLHVGHARGAIFGDTLARLLAFAGYEVVREYYWNDAGTQVDNLAKATYWRYLQALGLSGSPSLPKGDAEIEYKGDYLVRVGEELANLYDNRYVDLPEMEWLPAVKSHSVEAMKKVIRKDLELLGVRFDNEVSEERLLDDGKVDAVIVELKKRKLIYHGQLEAPKGNSDAWKKREQMLFRSSDFGDELDRPLTKSDGSWTYFAGDIAYHLDKYRRGFNQMINIWGADHGGYVPRVRAAVSALTDDLAKLSVALCQMVRLFDRGEPVKMSKRSGNFVTVRDLIETMDERVGRGQGKDVIRFIMLTRKNDAPLDFDFSKSAEQSRDNPVFYVQYAHARICSVFRRAQELAIVDIPPKVDFEYTYQKTELRLLKLLADWPRIIELASVSREPHRVVFYLNDLASEFHSLWNMGNDNPQTRFIVEGNLDITRARLALLEGVRVVLVSGLQGILGVVPQIEMR